MKDNPTILIIFDENINENNLNKKILSLSPKIINLFPITSNWRIINSILSNLKNLAGTDRNIKLINSSELIDKEVDIIRGKVSKWSADLGNFKIAGKSIKKWFLLPKNKVSTWWFSMLSEKNTYKTDVFFRLAQLQAIDKIITSDYFDICILSVSEKRLSSAIAMMFNRHSIRTVRISTINLIKKTLLDYIKPYFARKTVFNSILKGLTYLSLFTLRAFRAKLVMDSLKNRVEPSENSILFISYFPAVDKESAIRGTLRNKFAIPIQEKLTFMKKKVIWIWMYVYLDGNKFSDAVVLANNFAKNGESNFLIHEFLSLKVLVRILIRWISQIGIFIKLKKQLTGQILYKNLAVPEGGIFIKNLMIESFVGWTGIEGILFFELYKKIFSLFPTVSHCIYYSEMHAWEKALNAAKQLKAPQMKSIGFQHIGVSRNFFHYFHHKSEISQQEKSISLPLPDILACNGSIPLSLLAPCGYPNLKMVEAIRQLYLSDYINNSDLSQKEKIVLITGSIDKQETKALISLFFESYPKPEGFKVWLKGHPSLPFETVLKELKMNAEDCGYIIKYDPISSLLVPAKIIIVGSSTVALEALIAGCKVITPIISERMIMSPLSGFEKFYFKVTSSEELKQAVEKIIRHKENQKNQDEFNNFISSYWCLDKSLTRWEQLLK